MENIRTYQHGVPRNLRFVKVNSEDGLFFDLVTPSNLKKHIELLDKSGHKAEVTNRKEVPPCLFRDFSDGSLYSYNDAVWKDGKDFYL